MRRPNNGKKDIGAIVRKYMPNMQHCGWMYQHLHQYPELGKHEVNTASFLVPQLKHLSFAVHEGIGGHGVTGVLHNGAGPTVLLRADMDGLPIREETGLKYASKVKQQNDAGETVPVMHACGHDAHMSCLLAALTLLAAARVEWAGTVVAVFQPNEEGGGGARAMVDDGLYAAVPVPDVILGQHVDARRAGNVAVCSGPFMAAADSFTVVIYGRGGHGSQPQFCIDPVVIAGYVLVRLQSIVSRAVSPLDAAVVTCGSIHGGSGENVIPDQVELKLNVRTYKPEVRERVLKAIEDIIKAECKASGAEREPLITPTSRFPVTANDPRISEPLHETFTDFFGHERSEIMEQLTGSEDFSNLAKPNKTPYAFWMFGGTDTKQWDDAERAGLLDKLPRNHSSKFAPAIEPTLTTGTQAMAIAALTFLG